MPTTTLSATPHWAERVARHRPPALQRWLGAWLCGGLLGLAALLPAQAQRPAGAQPPASAQQAAQRYGRLPAGTVDLAIMVDVYHALAWPFEVLASITRALKPGGLLVFVEYRAEDPHVPIKALHKMSQAQIKREAAVHPLDWQRTAATLPWQHLVVFRKRG